VLSGASGNLDVNRCKSCGFVYLASWEQSLAKSQELYDYYGRLSEADLTRRYSPENRARQQELLTALAGHTRGRRLLDVGCGDGQLLQTAKDEGWDAVGIDLAETAILLCHRRGLTASKTDFFDGSLDEKRFDVIVMSELIEHVPSPQRFLKRAEELLDAGGVLYLTTPNFGSLARRMLGALRKIASEQTRLREIKIEANNIAPSTFVGWLRARGAPTTGEAAEMHRDTRKGIDQRLRRAVLRSRSLGTTKDLLNHAISRAGLGDTLVAWLQKPPA